MLQKWKALITKQWQCWILPRLSTFICLFRLLNSLAVEWPHIALLKKYETLMNATDQLEASSPLVSNRIASATKRYATVQDQPTAGSLSLPSSRVVPYYRKRLSHESLHSGTMEK